MLIFLLYLFLLLLLLLLLRVFFVQRLSRFSISVCAHSDVNIERKYLRFARYILRVTINGMRKSCCKRRSSNVAALQRANFGFFLPISQESARQHCARSFNWHAVSFSAHHVCFLFAVFFSFWILFSFCLASSLLSFGCSLQLRKLKMLCEITLLGGGFWGLWLTVRMYILFLMLRCTCATAQILTRRSSSRFLLHLYSVFRACALLVILDRLCHDLWYVGIIILLLLSTSNIRKMEMEIKSKLPVIHIRHSHYACTYDWFACATRLASFLSFVRFSTPTMVKLEMIQMTKGRWYTERLDIHVLSLRRISQFSLLLFLLLLGMLSATLNPALSLWFAQRNMGQAYCGWAPQSHYNALEQNNGMIQPTWQNGFGTCTNTQQNLKLLSCLHVLLLLLFVFACRFIRLFILCTCAYIFYYLGCGRLLVTILSLFVFVHFILLF